MTWRSLVLRVSLLGLGFIASAALGIAASTWHAGPRLQLIPAPGPAFPSESFRRTYEVTELAHEERHTFTVTPRQTVGDNGWMLYIHGGGYAGDLQAMHWTIIEGLMDRTSTSVVVPLYPLAPEHDWRAGFETIHATYQQLVAAVGADSVVIAGDSAGGGLALAFTEQLRDEARPLPAALVLLSPWLDVTLSDPAQQDLDGPDQTYATSLRQMGEWWAGDLPPTDPRISPLFGSVEGLPPMAVFAGTDDLLYSDALRLSAKAQEARVPLTLYTYRDQPHVWMGLPPDLNPEAGRALDEAATFVLEHIAPD